MIVLDGCCGAGGAARGYASAGHLVYGIDNRLELEHDYLKAGAAGFLYSDILAALAAPWVRKVDFIHVSPPCQFYSQMSRCRPDLAASYPDLIGPVRELLNASGKPWVIENVEAAGPWLKDPVILCGFQFGRPMYRHRLFEAGGGFSFRAPEPPHGASAPSVYRIGECGKLAQAIRTLTGWEIVITEDPYYGGSSHLLARLPDGRLLDAEGLHDPAEFPPAEPAGGCDCEACYPWDEPGVRTEAARLLCSVMPGPRKSCGWPHPVPAAKAGHWVPGTFVSVAGHERRGPVNAAMGIGWMRNREDVAEAIPPAFTEWIGRQLGA